MNQHRLWTLLLLLITAAWGASFVIIHEAVEKTDPYAFVAVRFTLSSLLILIIRPRSIIASLTPAVWKDGAVLGLLLALGYLTQTLSLTLTSSSNAAFITGLSVVLVPLLLVLSGKHLEKTTWLAVVLATLGLALLTIEPRSIAINRGDVIVLVTAFAFAGQIILTSRYSDRHHLWALTFTELATTACFSWIAWYWIGSNSIAWHDITFWSALGFASIVCTVIAYLVMNAAQRILLAWEAGLVFTTEPLFTAVIAVYFGFEALQLRTVIGGLLMLGAMVIVELSQRKTS